MIPSNFHTHTVRCHHAYGTEREYIEAAIEIGMTDLGFSDHAPIPFKTGYVSGIRMLMSEAEEYVSRIRQLAEEYKDRINIYVGFECEYVPEFWDEQIEFYDRLGIEYLIMGEHFFENEEFSSYSGHDFYDSDFLKKYVDAVLEGAATGRFLYIAHPDIVNFKGDTKLFKAELKRMLVGLKELNIPVEINALGYECNKQYPNPMFWDLVAEVGNEAIVGLDAHDPEMVKNESAYNVCVEMLRSRGITQTFGNVGN